MQAVQPSFKKSIAFSVVFHFVVLMVLIMNYDFGNKMPVLENARKNEVINARVLIAPPTQSKTVSLPRPVPPQPVSPDPIKPIEPPKVAEKKIVEPLVTKQAIIIPDKKIKKLAQEKLAREKLLQKKLAQEKLTQQLLADLKKQTEVKKKIKAKQVALEMQKQMRALAEKSLQQQMLQEQKRMADARAQQMQGEVNKFKALILQAIGQHWVLPGSTDRKLFAELLIRVAPGGAVLDVQLMRSSGDDVLDRSARAAVFKASPLPVPSESDAFDSFRQFVLKVKPEDILGADTWVQ